jgi:hypothetical protein
MQTGFRPRRMAAPAAPRAVGRATSFAR